MEGTKSSLCLLAALNSYLPYCDDISQEDWTASSFLNPNHLFCLCERVSSPLERGKQTNECEGVSLPAPSPWGRMKRPGKALYSPTLLLTGAVREDLGKASNIA